MKNKSNTTRLPEPEDTSFRWSDMLKAIFFFLEKQKKKYIFVTAVLIIMLFFDLLPAFVVGKIVDFFNTYKSGDTLTPFYSYIIFLSITLGVVSMIRLSAKRDLATIQADVTYTARVKGFDRLLDFSMKWHDTENTGNKVQKIQQGTDAMKNLQHILSNNVFPQLTTLIGVLISFGFIRANFVLFGFIYVSLFLAIQMFFNKRLVAIAFKNNTLLEKASGTYYEGLSNLLTIKTLGVKDDFKTNINMQEGLSKTIAQKRIILSINKWKAFQIINAIAIGVLLWISGLNFLSGAISLGLFFVVYSYFQKLSGVIGDSSGTMDDLLSAKVAIARMMPIFWDESTTNKGTLDFPKDWQALSVSKGFFRYHSGEKVVRDSGLSDLNIEIKKHEKIGIVGKSGSGKSTFAKVLLGLYDFEKSEYKIGNTDFYSLRHSEITDNLALVLQDSEMFNLSLKDNITLMRKFNRGLFNQAAEIAALDDLIKKLPEGVDTLIGEKGYRLSGGERQRIGIARAIYKDPQILILDEATSSLDSNTEEAVLKALEKKLQKKTVISIAHRISTLKNSDRIVVFDQGTIVEEGTFNALSKDSNSKFHEIYQSQQMNAKVSK